MKIIRGKLERHVHLHDIKVGECLIFEFAPHQKHKDGDVFIRVDFSAYPPEEWKSTRYRSLSRNKCAVVNMRTGALAFIARDRDCYPVTTALHVEE